MCILLVFRYIYIYIYIKSILDWCLSQNSEAAVECLSFKISSHGIVINCMLEIKELNRSISFTRIRWPVSKQNNFLSQIPQATIETLVPIIILRSASTTLVTIDKAYFYLSLFKQIVIISIYTAIPSSIETIKFKPCVCFFELPPYGGSYKITLVCLSLSVHPSAHPSVSLVFSSKMAH